MRLKWWQWAIIALVAVFVGGWVVSGENPVTSFMRGFEAGSSSSR
jgi:hypothetical protein